MESKYWILAGAFVIGVISMIVRSYYRKLDENGFMGEENGIDKRFQEESKRQLDYKTYVSHCASNNIQPFPDHQDFYWHWRFIL